MNISCIDWSQPIQKHKNHLPHWQQENTYQFVSWHLGDALSVSTRRKIKFEKNRWLRLHPKPWSPLTERDYYERFEGRIQAWLDSGMGSCLLRSAKTRAVVEKSLFIGDGTQYEMEAFVIMPNHVHTLFAPLGEQQLDAIMQTLKSVTSHKINALLNRPGELWMEDYWDRMIRDETHFLRVKRYICRNPVKAKLRPEDFTLWVRPD